jgi:hypothetical protein
MSTTLQRRTASANANTARLQSRRQANANANTSNANTARRVQQDRMFLQRRQAKPRKWKHWWADRRDGFSRIFWRLVGHPVVDDPPQIRRAQIPRQTGGICRMRRRA